jgi:hypothetical protein
VPFFNLVSFIIGTYINTITKKKRLTALRKKHFGDGRSTAGSTVGGGPRPDDYPPHPPLGPNPPYESRTEGARSGREDIKSGVE